MARGLVNAEPSGSKLVIVPSALRTKPCDVEPPVEYSPVTSPAALMLSASVNVEPAGSIVVKLAACAGSAIDNTAKLDATCSPRFLSYIKTWSMEWRQEKNRADVRKHGL